MYVDLLEEVNTEQRKEAGARTEAEQEKGGW